MLTKGSRIGYRETTGRNNPYRDMSARTTRTTQRQTEEEEDRQTEEQEETDMNEDMTDNTPTAEGYMAGCTQA